MSLLAKLMDKRLGAYQRRLIEDGDFTCEKINRITQG